MKGLLNNTEAVDILENLIGTEENRIHQIYNLGYKKGYEDGYHDCIQRLTEKILAEMRADES